MEAQITLANGSVMKFSGDESTEAVGCDADMDLAAAVAQLHERMIEHMTAIEREAESLGLPPIRVQMYIEDYASKRPYLRAVTG